MRESAAKAPALVLAIPLLLLAGGAGAQNVSQALRDSDADGDGVLQRSEAPIDVLTRFSQIDRDGDGGIDSFEAWQYDSHPSPERSTSPKPAERRAPGEGEPVRVKSFVEFVRRADRNGDGKLGLDEVPVAQRDGFVRVDANGDGFIDLEEAGRVDEGRERLTEPASQQRTFVRLVGFMDTDGDGRLQKKEAPLRVQAIFEELDRNRDGAIDLEEAAAADAAAAKAAPSGAGP
jgi:Ca2+-binding EF-hand superfamily protein